jgi:hypothetical protein
MIEMITTVTCMIMSEIVGESLRFVDEDEDEDEDVDEALGSQEGVGTARDVPFGHIFPIGFGEQRAKHTAKLKMLLVHE